MDVSFLHKLPLRRILGWILIAGGLAAFGSLLSKEIRLITFGKHSKGVIEKITEEHHSSRKGSGVSHRLHVVYTPEGGGAEARFDTISTFGFDSKVGDAVEVVYIPNVPGRAKIYSAKQLWLPALVGTLFSSGCVVGGWLLLRRRGSKP